jgi:hypothetical protein
MAFDSRLLGGIGVLAAVVEIGNFVRAVYRYASRKLGR